MSDEFLTNRGVRQGNPLSSKLFIAVIEQIFKKKDISKEISVGGEHHTNKAANFKHLGQTTHLKDTIKEEIYAGIRAAWNCFGKKER